MRGIDMGGIDLGALPIELIVLIALAVAAVSAAAYVLVAGRQRRQIMGRMDGRSLAAAGAGSVLIGEEESWTARLGASLRGLLPASWYDSAQVQGKLVQAGYDGGAAPAIYATIRLGFGALLPLGVFVMGWGADGSMFLLYLVLAAAIGLLGPAGVLDRLVTQRQLRLRRSVPDSLDLLLVCVEAGVTLDSAMLRVAREMRTSHPELAGEFLVVTRKVNAGVAREVAMQGLWTRTGLEELRGLASSMVQCEKWGTSIATVLRVYSETLRRKRRQMAEKKAGQAAVKMMVPLILFLLPALFVVIIGPGAMAIGKMLDAMGGG